MTVKVWFVYEGADSLRRRAKYVLPTRRDIKYALPLETCMERIGLAGHQWISAASKGPRSGRGLRLWPLTAFAVPRHVICEIDETEAKASGWRIGYYRIDLSPTEVTKRLGQAPLS